jgi:2-hydroxychromene-2-carboxylate isomerase
MPRELDFFFYIASTYTYLSVNRIEEIAVIHRIAPPARRQPLTLSEVLSTPNQPLQRACRKRRATEGRRSASH